MSLHNCAYAGDLDGLKRSLLEYPDGINALGLARHSFGLEKSLGNPFQLRAMSHHHPATPLMWAAFSREKEICKYLLEKGADPCITIVVPPSNQTVTAFDLLTQSGEWPPTSDPTFRDLLRRSMETHKRLEVTSTSTPNESTIRQDRSAAKNESDCLQRLKSGVIYLDVTYIQYCISPAIISAINTSFLQILVTTSPPCIEQAPPTLVAIDISNSSGAAIAALIKYLTTSGEHLESVVLSEVEFTPTAFAELLPHLIRPNIKSVVLSNNYEMDWESSAPLFEEAIPNANWESLDMSNCKLDRDALSCVLRGIAGSHTLSLLDLHNNLCKFQSWPYFVDLFREHPSLCQLDFPDVTSEIVRNRGEIIDLIRNNFTFMNVWYQDCILQNEEDFTDAVHTMLSRNSTLGSHNIQLFWKNIRPSAKFQIKRLIYVHQVTGFMPSDVLFDVLIPYLVMAMDGLRLRRRVPY